MAASTKIKQWLKRILAITYTDDGGCYLSLQAPVQIKLPLKINLSWFYRTFCASQPIQPNKIVFDNYMGKGFGCNPKYVAQQLLEQYPGKLDLVWVVSKHEAKDGALPEGIRAVPYASLRAQKEYATAGVWVSNYHKIFLLRRGVFKRPEQKFIQMWHGSLGIKKIENDVPGLKQDAGWLSLAQKSSAMVDYWISNSTFETEIYRRAFWNVGTVLEYGHPRNDILCGDTTRARGAVEQWYGLRDKKILFYAPTFREDYRLDCYDLDYPALLQSLSDRFGGEWVALVRLHPRIRNQASQVLPKDSRVLDATFYPDIQELLAAADCMITDYSSCVFDFMLTGRPAFLFATDVEEYNTERGFYYPLETTPFPLAQDNQSLTAQVRAFDGETYRQQVAAFLQEKGCVEDGHASERVAELIAALSGVQR